MRQPANETPDERLDRPAMRQFGAPHPPSPVPGRRSLQIPDGSWIDGLEPGFETPSTRAKRIAAAQPPPDPLAHDAAGQEALRVFATMGRRVKPSERPLPTVSSVHNQRRDDLARQLDGIIEVDMRPCRADAATGTVVFEVKPRKKLEEGAQQAVAYSARCGLQPALAVYGAIPHEELTSLYLMLRERRYFGLRAAAHLQLWWWTGTRWDYISTRSRCVNMPHGSMFARCTYCRREILWLAGDGPGRACHNYDPDADYDCSAERYEHHCKGLCAAEHQPSLRCQLWQEPSPPRAQKRQ